MLTVRYGCANAPKDAKAPIALATGKGFCYSMQKNVTDWRES